MRKRIIALLLALILTVGLLPTVALAAEGETPTTDSGSVTKEARKDNLNLVKTVTKDGENYKVTLESWATGIVTTTTETKPLDIVLLLDVSGSMDEKYSNETIEKFVPYDYRYINFLLGYETTNSDLNDYQDTRYGVWYKIPNSETYVSVKVEKEWKLFADDDYTYSYEQNGSTIIIEKTSNGNKPPKTQFYYKESANTTKLDALKTAVSAFIDNVATNSPNSNISIVKFADDSYKNAEGNDTFWQGDYEYNYTQIVKKLTKVNTAGVTALKKAISELRAGGATASDYGLNKAQEALKDAKQERVVILFTDGEPNHQSGFDKQVATDAVNKAKELKSSNPKTTIYTVGVFKNPSTDVNTYMSSVSSNYPNASAAHKNGNWKVTNGGSDFGKYYMNATSPVDLLKAFETISSEVSGGELGAEAVLTDVIAPNFALVAPEGTTGVTAYTVDKTADGWSTQKTTLTNGVTIGADGQVSVTGFDYSENCVTTTAKPNTTDDYGKKLVVEFTIHHNNYGGTQPTNAGASIKDKENKDVITVDNPTVPVTIAKPSITGVTRSKVYDGTGFDVLSTIAEDINALADGKKNAYVDIVVTVTSGSNTYTYTISKGATTGSWDKTGLTTEKDVKIENGAVSSYTYDLSITFKDATANGAADAIEKTTATYTITKRPVTLTSASGEKKWDGTALTNDTVTVSAGEGNTVGGFVTGEGATYDVTGSQTNVGSSDNTFTYTLNEGTKDTNYEITQKTGTLTVKPIDQEVVITIKGQIVTATYDGEEKTASGYTVTVPEGVDANKITVAVAEGKTVPSVSATDATTTALVQTITDDMFTVTSPYKKVTINCENGSLTINPRKVKMVSGSASKAWDGTALTNSTVTDSGFEGYDGFVNGQGATYNVTGTITNPGSEDNRFTYTLNSNTKASNYDITTAYGKLTITGSKTYTVIFKTTTPGGKIDSGIADVTHTDLTEGVSFPNRPITTPDTGYYFDGWYKDNTKVTSFPTTVTENATYTAKWLSYNSINLDLTGKIQKTLNSDVALTNEIFTINLTLNGAEVPSATATATVSATTASGTGYTGSAPFQTATDEFKLTFTAPGIYNYSIVEEDGQLAGMTYDVNKPTDGHKLTVNVTADDTTHALSFESVTVDGTSIADVTVATTWLTITNTYTEPKEPRVVSKTVVTTDMVDTLPPSVSSDIEAFKNKVDILYPVVNGEASTLEVPYGTKSVTLLYKITVNAGTKTSMQFEDVGAERVSVFDDDNVDVSQVGRTFTVRFYRGVTTADIYVAKTYKNLVFDSNGECTVENVISEEIKATTTVTEKDPNKLTINFADYVQKELAATGTKTASDVDFTVDVKGKEQTMIIASAEGEEAISTYADEFDPKYSRTLTAHFDSITGGEVKTTRFTGTTVEIDHAGHYTFFLGEEKGTRTGVTYDEARYTLYINVRLDQNENKLYVSSMGAIRTNADGTWENIALIEMVNDEPVRTTNYITFHNTIDTGKDDYYPIIIPTIINKDTGMLNKTDHFAYVIGYPDGTVHPNGQITRAEVATIFFRLLRDEVRDGAFTTSNSYSDVAYGKWYNNPISTMSALGIITGYPDGTFKPNKPITRAEFAAIAARFDETQSGKSATFSDVIGHWAAKEIGIAYYNDWIKGYPDGTFKPDQNITRAEAMTLINRVLERKPESPADLLTNMNKWTDNMDTSKWYYLDVQEATNSHGYTRKTFNYELWRQMLPDPDWSRYER